MDDDAAWLLADDMPRAVNRPEAPLDEAPLDEAPLDEAPLDEAPLDEAPLDEAPLDEAPICLPPMDRSPIEARGPTTKDHPWLAIGEAFHPLPGRPLLVPADGPQPAAEVAAEWGATVHAVLPGVVHRSGPGLELRLGDGRVIGYRGEAPVQWTVGDGEPVAAGAILGWINPAPAATQSGAVAKLVIYLVQADGVTVDPVRWLAGLADPRELNLAGGMDPFRTDLRLAGLWDGPAESEGVPR